MWRGRLFTSWWMGIKETDRAQDKIKPSKTHSDHSPVMPHFLRFLELSKTVPPAGDQGFNT
jgi:hypothetical protein